MKKVLFGALVALLIVGFVPSKVTADSTWQTHEVKIQNESNQGIYPATVRVKRLGYDGQTFERQTEYTTGAGGWVTLNSGNMPKEQEWWYEIEVTAAGYNTWTGTLRFTWDNNINVITLSCTTPPAPGKVSTLLTVRVNPTGIPPGGGTDVTVSGRLTRADTGAGVAEKSIILNLPGVYTYGRTDSGGNYTYSYSTPNLVVGSHPVEARFDGDSSFSSSQAQTTLAVGPKDTSISISPSPSTVTSGSPTEVSITGKLIDSATKAGIPNKQVEIEWPEGRTNVTTTGTGAFSHTVSVSPTGNWVIQGTFWGDSSYTKSWNQAILTVRPPEPSEQKDTTISISLSPSTATSGEPTKVTVSGRLTTSDSGKGIPSKNIEVQWPEGRTNVVTDADGNFSLGVHLTTDKSWVFQATFWGDNVYNKSWNQAILTVRPPEPSTLQVSLTVSPTSGGTSTQFAFSVSVQGGTSPYMVHLRDRSSQNLAASQSGGPRTYTFQHSFPTPGAYYVHGFVRDASGNTAGTNEISITVERGGEPKPTGDVKFCGTVSRIMLPDYEVKVEQILEDPGNHLKIGELAWITAVNQSCVKGTIAVEDYVDVYGKPTMRLPGQPQLWLEQSYHYIRTKEPPTLQASLTLPSTRGDTSTRFTFNVTVQGGTYPYTIYLRDRNSQDLAPSQSGSSTRYTFKQSFPTPGTYYVHGFVRDADSNTTETNDIRVEVEEEWIYRTIIFEVLNIQLWEEDTSGNSKKHKNIHMEYTVQECAIAVKWGFDLKTDELNLEVGRQYKTPSTFKKERNEELPQKVCIIIRVYEEYFKVGSIQIARYPPVLKHHEPIKSGETLDFDIYNDRLTAKVRVKYETPLTPPPTTTATVDEAFDLLDDYFENEPSQQTGGRVPTVDDVFQYLDRYFQTPETGTEGPPAVAPPITPQPTTTVSAAEVFNLLDDYFGNHPSALTDGRVPTTEDVFEYLDRYFE